MARVNRRRFFQQTLAAAATITIAGTKSSGQVRGANEAIRVAVAGLNGRGGSHVSGYLALPNVQVTYLVDPDTRTFATKARQIRDRGGNNPRTVQDVRQALEDNNVDAVSIATPNHWHALMTVWAAQHGKHVYVEKPSSHNVKEGRMAVEFARRHNVIVQHGTQSRSDANYRNLVEHVRSGRYGQLKYAYALCYKLRNSIGTRPHTDPPREVDFNLWLGPAREQPHHANLVHYNWHWFWDFGNGDIGNQGVHQMDIARWGIANATLPRSVITLGGRFGYTDQGETPNTEFSVLDFGSAKLIFEVRGLRTPAYRGHAVGNYFVTDNGILANNAFFPRGSDRGEPLPASNRAARPGGGHHFANFIAAVRSGRTQDLNADVLEGHYSSACCHLANVSYQLGENRPYDAADRRFADENDIFLAYRRMFDHLSGNGVRLDNLQLKVGRRLDIDAAAESIRNDEPANRLLTREYRRGFVVPERVG